LFIVITIIVGMLNVNMLHSKNVS